jgi:NDP-sugar pyrophosphorylase family protein
MDLPVAILCGGQGTRLRPMTDMLPKPLIPVNGRPMLDYILEGFRSKGLRRFIFCVGYKGDLIEKHVRHQLRDCEAMFSNAGEQASMLERIWALREFPVERVLVTYGDTFTDLELDTIMEYHLKSRVQVTMVTARVQIPFGLIKSTSDGLVTSFEEKPILACFLGTMIVELSAMEFIRSEMLKMPGGEGLEQFFQQLAIGRRLGAFHHTGITITFNTESEHRAAEKALVRYHTFAENL